MSSRPKIYIVAGPTASGKSGEAIRLAKEQDGEVISVDSRQVYRTLDIGTEKLSPEEMEGVPHHLIDIREPEERYSAGDFVQDASMLIAELQSKGKTPILAGGTHFYFDALLYGLPAVPENPELRLELETLSDEELLTEIRQKDPERYTQLDTQNRRRLVRALEIIRTRGKVPTRTERELPYDIEWIVLNPSSEELRPRIDERLKKALTTGLIDEVRRTRERVGDVRLNELGLEYRIVGEYLRGERTDVSLFPALSAKLWHYARHQKAWLRKLNSSRTETES